MQSIDMLLETTREFLHQTAAFLPQAAAGAGGGGDRLADRQGGALCRRARLARDQFQRAHRTGRHRQFSAARRACAATPRTLFGLVAFWLVMLATLMIAFNGLGLTYITDLLGRVVLFTPKLLVAMLIVVFGSYCARFVGSAVHNYCVRCADPRCRHAGPALRATSS